MVGGTKTVEEGGGTTEKLQREFGLANIRGVLFQSRPVRILGRSPLNEVCWRWEANVEMNRGAVQDLGWVGTVAGQIEKNRGRSAVRLAWSGRLALGPLFRSDLKVDEL